jgi:hypothetical protein
MTATLQFDVSCPKDGGAFEYITGAKLVVPTESTCIVRCTECRTEFQAIVHLRPVGNAAATERRRELRRRSA